MSELKECPFCGHVVEGIIDGEASMLPNFCEHCGAKVVRP